MNNRYYASRGEGQSEDSRGLLAQLLPIILVLAVSLLGGLFNYSSDADYYQSYEPKYNMHKTAYYNQLKKTKNRHVDYFVNENEYNRYNSKLSKNKGAAIHRFENKVESNIISMLSNMCQQERSNKQKLIMKYEGFVFGKIGRNEEKLKEAENIKLESCEKLNKYLSYYQLTHTHVLRRSAF